MARNRWDRDMATFTTDLRFVEKFFRDILGGQRTDTQRDSIGMRLQFGGHSIITKALVMK